MSLNAALSSRAEKGFLSDSVRREGPFRPFTSDPGWNEAWWWLGIPATVAILLVLAGALAPDFYRQRILPEGYGLLELSHFFIPLAGMIIAVRLLFRPLVRERKLIFVLVCVAALSCFFIAGEEHNWGQHFFNWEASDYWAHIDRQRETNLHNIRHHFERKPRVLLELGVLIGGLIVPLLAQFRRNTRRNRWSLFLPADAMVPTALCVWFFKLIDKALNLFHISAIVPRPSEAVEFFLYLFILYYLIVFTRRIKELERESPAG